MAPSRLRGGECYDRRRHTWWGAKQERGGGEIRVVESDRCYTSYAGGGLRRREVQGGEAVRAALVAIKAIVSRRGRGTREMGRWCLQLLHIQTMVKQKNIQQSRFQ
jgi:hypothetical protein